MNRITKAAKQTRAHIFEIDFIRVITVTTVFALHALSMHKASFTPETLPFYYMIGHSLHFNRETFMFVTAFVLTYVYFGREFSACKFWTKRLLLIIIPYLLWSLIYTWYRFPDLDLMSYLQQAESDIRTGNASYQLYYVFLTLQFYALFPLFLLIFKKIRHHMPLVLLISFIVQIVFLFLDFKYIVNGPLKTYLLWIQAYAQYQDRLIFTYQFFFIFGAVAALYIDRAKGFMLKYGKYFTPLFLLTWLLYIGYFFLQVRLGLPLQKAAVLLQPSVALYSIVAIITFLWWAMKWAQNRPYYRIIHALAEVSFGIYLAHVLFLRVGYKYIFVQLRDPNHPYLSILIFSVAVFILTAVSCYIVYRIPLLSWTIGRARAVKLTFWKKSAIDLP